MQNLLHGDVSEFHHRMIHKLFMHLFDDQIE